MHEDPKPWLNSLVACLPDGVAFLRPNWTILWLNREMSRLLFPDGGGEGQSLLDCLEEPNRFLDKALAGMEGKRRATVPVTLKRGDGVLTAHIAECEPGLPARWSICVREAPPDGDVRRQLEDRERSYSFLRAATSDAILRVSPALEVTWCNESAGRWFAVGQGLAGVLSGGSLEALEQVMANSGGAERQVVRLESVPGAGTPMCLEGPARRLLGEDGTVAGLSLVLRDESDGRVLESCAERLGLSPREREVFELLVQGYTNLNMAMILGISESGIKFHIRNLFARAKVGSRTELMAQLFK